MEEHVGGEYAVGERSVETDGELRAVVSDHAMVFGAGDRRCRVYQRVEGVLPEGVLLSADLGERAGPVDGRTLP